MDWCWTRCGVSGVFALSGSSRYESRFDEPHRFSLFQPWCKTTNNTDTERLDLKLRGFRRGVGLKAWFMCVLPSNSKQYGLQLQYRDSTTWWRNTLSFVSWWRDTAAPHGAHTHTRATVRQKKRTLLKTKTKNISKDCNGAIILICHNIEIMKLPYRNCFSHLKKD